MIYSLLYVGIAAIQMGFSIYDTFIETGSGYNNAVENLSRYKNFRYINNL